MMVISFFMIAPCINSIKTLFIVPSDAYQPVVQACGCRRAVHRTSAQQADMPP
jgi:hypothetical protein